MTAATMRRVNSEARRPHPILAAAMLLAMGVYVSCLGVVVVAAVRGNSSVAPRSHMARPESTRRPQPEIGPQRMPTIGNGSAFAMWGMAE